MQAALKAPQLKQKRQPPEPAHRAHRSVPLPSFRYIPLLLGAALVSLTGLLVVYVAVVVVAPSEALIATVLLALAVSIFCSQWTCEWHEIRGHLLMLRGSVRAQAQVIERIMDTKIGEDGRAFVVYRAVLCFTVGDRAHTFDEPVEPSVYERLLPGATVGVRYAVRDPHVAIFEWEEEQSKP